MSWPRQESQNPLDNRECKWKTWISWVWGFEVVHAVKGSFEVALPPNASLPPWPLLLEVLELGLDSLDLPLPRPPVSLLLPKVLFAGVSAYRGLLFTLESS